MSDLIRVSKGGSHFVGHLGYRLSDKTHIQAKHGQECDGSNLISQGHNKVHLA